LTRKVKNLWQNLDQRSYGENLGSRPAVNRSQCQAQAEKDASVAKHRDWRTIFNLREALLEPFAHDGSAGFVPDIQGMLQADYDARGWDGETGKPSKKKLVQLDMADLAETLWDG
jgi:aldehyde:ferredoxin oxidoreductase